MESEKLRGDVGSAKYESARREMVEELHRIAAVDKHSGYERMAGLLAMGSLVEVPTWIALSLMTTRAPADLRSALEALELADATLRGANMNRNVVERNVGDAIASLRAALALNGEAAS